MTNSPPTATPAIVIKNVLTCRERAAAVNESLGPKIPFDDDAPGLGAPPLGPLVPPPSRLVGAVDAGGSEDDDDDEGGAEVVPLPEDAEVGVGVIVTTILLTMVLSCLFEPKTTSEDTIVDSMGDTEVGEANCEPDCCACDDCGAAEVDGALPDTCWEVCGCWEED